MKPHLVVKRAGASTWEQRKERGSQTLIYKIEAQRPRDVRKKVGDGLFGLHRVTSVQSDALADTTHAPSQSGGKV